jgi:hypothetical protein
MGKRKASNSEGGASKKKYHQNSGNKKAHGFTVQPGMRGFLVSCLRNQENKSQREALDMLGQVR